ncbi:hypothetical protein EVAR_62647_1 [Eumeta japonica]|uniref:Uncharacterized protein n=1 Tax=Eumeta variegata TaxID=151549 RepID=A0A4C1ZAZ8_EUMVA|nr:hypothetical protein EVAR_62647_1 [Eumeta japonica]
MNKLEKSYPYISCSFFLRREFRLVPPSRSVAFGQVPWTSFSLVCNCVYRVPLSRVSECRALHLYEYFNDFSRRWNPLCLLAALDEVVKVYGLTAGAFMLQGVFSPYESDTPSMTGRIDCTKRVYPAFPFARGETQKKFLREICLPNERNRARPPSAAYGLCVLGWFQVRVTSHEYSGTHISFKYGQRVPGKAFFMTILVNMAAALDFATSMVYALFGLVGKTFPQAPIRQTPTMSCPSSTANGYVSPIVSHFGRGGVTDALGVC